MLGIMRKYKQSVVIKIVFCIIVFSFIGTIFLVWGRGDETGSSDFAAKVNGTKISFDDYQKNYYRLKGLYEQIYGRSITPELEKQLGIKKMAVESLIDNTLLIKEAKRMGISVNKDEIANESQDACLSKGWCFRFQSVYADAQGKPHDSCKI